MEVSDSSSVLGTFVYRLVTRLSLPARVREVRAQRSGFRGRVAALVVERPLREEFETVCSRSLNDESGGDFVPAIFPERDAPRMLRLSARPEKTCPEVPLSFVMTAIPGKAFEFAELLPRARKRSVDAARSRRAGVTGGLSAAAADPPANGLRTSSASCNVAFSNGTSRSGNFERSSAFNSARPPSYSSASARETPRKKCARSRSAEASALSVSARSPASRVTASRPRTIAVRAITR